MNDGQAWESILNEAVAKTRQSLTIRRNQMDEQKRTLMETIQSKDDQIAELQMRLQSREVLAKAKEHGGTVHFEAISPSKDDPNTIVTSASKQTISQLDQTDRELMKQCALFNDVQSEKSRFSVADDDALNREDNKSALMVYLDMHPSAQMSNLAGALGPTTNDDDCLRLAQKSHTNESQTIKQDLNLSECQLTIEKSIRKEVDCDQVLLPTKAVESKNKNNNASLIFFDDSH